MIWFCGLLIFQQTEVNEINVCEHVLSANCHLYWIPPPPNPRVCVLSPLLYILYTGDCRSNQEKSYLVSLLMTVLSLL